MRKVKTIETITCDFCNKDCTEENMSIKKIRLTHSYSGESVNEVVLEVKPSIPYGPNEPDICSNCLHALLLKTYSKSEKISKDGEFTTYDTSNGNCGLCGRLGCHGGCFK